MQQSSGLFQEWPFLASSARVRRLMDCTIKLKQSVNTGSQFRQGFELINDERQVVQDVRKGHCRLLDDAQRDIAREVFRRHHDQRDDPNEIRIQGGEEVKIPLCHIDIVHIPNDGPKAQVHGLGLDVFSLVECDGFRIFPDPDQGESEIRLPLQLDKVEDDQFLANQPRGGRPGSAKGDNGQKQLRPDQEQNDGKADQIQTAVEDGEKKTTG